MRLARDARGLTQNDVASACQVHKDTYLRWESGKKDPRPGQLFTIARALGVQERWLRTGQGPSGLEQPHLVPPDPVPEHDLGPEAALLGLPPLGVSPPLRTRFTPRPPPSVPLPAEPTADEATWRPHVYPPPHGLGPPYPLERWYVHCPACGAGLVPPAQFMAHLRSCSPQLSPSEAAAYVLNAPPDPAPHAAELARLRWLAACMELSAKAHSWTDPRRRELLIARDLYAAAARDLERTPPASYRIPESWG